jgi:hypothetical protein
MNIAKGMFNEEVKDSFSYQQSAFIRIIKLALSLADS